MTVISLDAQVRMAAHLKKCGWKVVPPQNHARSHVMHERLGQAGGTPLFDSFDVVLGEKAKQVCVDEYLKVQAAQRRKKRQRQDGLTAGTICHKLLSEFAKSGPMTTAQVCDSLGWNTRHSGRISELLSWGMIEIVEHAPNRDRVYSITPKGAKIIKELANA